MSDTPEKPTPAHGEPPPPDAPLEVRKAWLDADLAAGREGPPPPPAAERLARVLAAVDLAKLPASEGGMALHDAAALLGVDLEDPLDVVQAWGRENTRLARDTIADALRRALADVLDRKGADLAPDVLADLRKWAAEDANPETLAEWLNRDGWGKVDGAAVEAALVTAARATAEADGLKDGLACVLWNSGAPYFVLLYDTARADVDKPDVRERIARKTAPHIDPLAALLVPEGRTPPDKATVLLGLDALKAGLQGFDWGGLGLCLTDKAGRAGDWLGRLAVPWMDERRAALVERLDRQAAAVELAKAPAVLTHGRKYGRLPKVAAGMSWAFGGPGVELARVTLDGREYAPAPDLAIAPPAAALVPAGYALLPADHAKRPHQTLLPIDTEGAEDAPPLPVALADATQYAIAPAGGKLGLLIMAAAHESRGRLHKTTLRELTQAINPDARLVRTHFETVCKVLPQLDGLRLVLPTGLAYRVFECPITWRKLTPEEYDLPLFVGLTRTFERTLAAIQDTAGASYRGDFLFDLTGAMKLPTRRPGLVRQYIRACAFWNAYWKPGTAGEPDPARVPEVSAERWAILTNYLTPAAEEYLRTKGKGKGNRRRLSDVLRDTLKDAEYLADEARLVKIERADRRAVRLLWRPEYLEAWRESRKGAHKIPGNTPDA
jgi:hypothetical protein